jgi:transposase-like protein
MKTNLTTYKRHRFPPEIIKHAVWLYFRFNLSHRDIEDLLAKRGIMVSYEAIRLWCNKFGLTYADVFLQKKRDGAAPESKNLFHTAPIIRAGRLIPNYIGP